MTVPLRLLQVVAGHFFPKLNNWFEEVADPRDPGRITYSMRHMLWAALLMFLTGSRSRNQMRAEGNRVGFHANLIALAGSAEEAATHPDNVDALLQALPPEELLALLEKLSKRLLRMRCFEAFRLHGEWPVAVDATELRSYAKRHCEHCLRRTLSNGKRQYFHAVLEARLVLSNGVGLLLAAVPIQNDGREYDKQDCEIKAFPRLMEQLRQGHSRLPICLLGDALYACEPVLRRCRTDRAGVIAVFKPGRSPKLWRTALDACARRPANAVTHRKADGSLQQFRWATNLPYGRETLHAIFCDEDHADGTVGHWAWLTDHRPNSTNVHQLANDGGRLRWKIENHFNELKNGQMELKHDYGSQGHAWFNYYLLAQVAQLLLQLIWHGSAVRKLTTPVVQTTQQLFRTIRHLSYRLRESLQRDRLTDLAHNIDPAAIHIRFDTS